MTDPDSGQPLGRGAVPRGDPSGSSYTSPSARGKGELPFDPAEPWLQRLGWSQSPAALVVAGLIISVVLLVAVAVVQVVLAPERAIVVGIVIVVILGAGGLAARGVGELRNSRYWKSSGSFLCAAAYLATATVGLINGVPLVFQE